MTHNYLNLTAYIKERVTLESWPRLANILNQAIISPFCS